LIHLKITRHPGPWALPQLGRSPRLAALAPRELGKPFHTVANFCARQAQLIKLLQIEPKLRAGTKPVAEPQRRVSRDRALPIDDPSDSIYWHVDLPRQFARRNAEFFQLFGKMLAGVPCFLLVVIDNLDVDRAGRVFRPLKAEAHCGDWRRSAGTRSWGAGLQIGFILQF